jgi:hypothetical protein
METHVFKMAAKFRDKKRTSLNADLQVPMVNQYRMSEPLDADESIAAPRLFGKNDANSISWSGAETSTCFQDGGQIQRPKEKRCMRIRKYDTDAHPVPYV